MSTDPKTLSVYDARARDYADMANSPVEMQLLSRFIAAFEPGNRVLDLGCGPGHAAAAMQRAGLIADATDGSSEMVALARQHAGITVRHESFEALAAHDLYHGIWASFSLLHATRAAFPGHLGAIRSALKPGGLLFIGMKLGSGEGRDALGRFYTYYGETELAEHLEDVGFTPIDRKTWEGAGLAGNVDPAIGIFANG